MHSVIALALVVAVVCAPACLAFGGVPTCQWTDPASGTAYDLSKLDSSVSTEVRSVGCVERDRGRG